MKSIRSLSQAMPDVRSFTWLTYKDDGIFRTYGTKDEDRLLELKSFELNINKEKYKLHLNINIDSYRTYLEPILKILAKAVDETIIDIFKVINTEVITTDLMKERLSDLLDSKKDDVYLNNYRQFSNPITIKLNEDSFLSDRLVDLCFELEYALRDCEIGMQSTSSADLCLLDFKHVYFRQETIGGVYQEIDFKNQSALDTLRTQGQESVLYKHLIQSIQERKKQLTDEMNNRDQIKINLRGFIASIDSHKTASGDIDFSYDFTFFKTTRGIAKRKEYEFAVLFLQELETKPYLPLHSLFAKHRPDSMSSDLSQVLKHAIEIDKKYYPGAYR